MAQTAAMTGNADLYLHIRVLVAIILGLSVTRLISGLATLIQHPGRTPIWSVHLGWVAWALLNVVTFWWWEFRLSFVQQWTFGLYAFMCVYHLSGNHWTVSELREAATILKKFWPTLR